MSDPSRIELRFQRTGYTDDEIAEYRRLFEDLGEVTTDTWEQPAAGPAFGLEVVLYFVFTAVVSGVLGGAAYDALKAASSRLVRIWQGRKQGKKYPPETSNIQINFSDRTIVLGNDDRGRYTPDEFSVHERVAEELASIVEHVSGHLRTPPLSVTPFKFLTVPVLAAQEGPDESLIKPNWKLSTEKHTRHGFGTYYDSTKKVLFEIKEA